MPEKTQQPDPSADTTKRVDFIRNIINEHLKTGKYNGKVITRFPPEPNGYLHIGHAKAICIDFGIAEEYGGKCHLRMDDTDPTKEDMHYVDAIKKDINWLGFDWGENLFFASDYFDQLYEYAEKLIIMGKAYVCSLTDEEIKEYRGTVTSPGKESPYRNRLIEENLKLFQDMKAGNFKDGAHVLRAKIDMSSPNMKMRDPLLYRIRHAKHYRTGDKWCIYPMYDFAHCLSDYIEGITHSICTLEFENNRELYDWILDELELKPPRPYQYEFARLNLNYTVMSKRKLLDLVEKKLVDGWDDPRLPTISGMRRRGFTPEAIRNFCDSIGIAKANSVVDMAQLEYCIRDDLNKKVPRVMCVLKPLKVIIENYPENKNEILDAPYYPHDVPKEGEREIPFSRELYIESDDFLDDPPKGYYRLYPGGEVRLRYAYIIKCEQVIKDETGKITELRCTYDPQTKSGEDTSSKKVKGTIHWVPAKEAKKVEVRLYDRLFLDEFPEGIEDSLNPDSLSVLSECLIEPAVAIAEPGSRFQFERQGYFYLDPVSTTEEKKVFNRIVQLRDSWTKKSKHDKSPGTAQLEKPAEKGQRPLPTESNKKRESTQQITPEIKEKADQYIKSYGLSTDEAAIIAKDDNLTAIFENAIKQYNSPKAIAGWIVNEILRKLKDTPIEELSITPQGLAELVELIDNKVITSKIAKDIFEELLKSGDSPKSIVKRKGLEQISDPAELELIINTIVLNNPENAAKYRNGKTNLLGFFVGQVMKHTKGKANPEIVNKILEEKLME